MTATPHPSPHPPGVGRDRVTTPPWPAAVAAAMGVLGFVCGFLPAYQLLPANSPTADFAGFQSYLFPIMLAVTVIGALAALSGDGGTAARLRLAAASGCVVATGIGIALTFGDDAEQTRLAYGFWLAVVAAAVQTVVLALPAGRRGARPLTEPN